MPTKREMLESLEEIYHEPGELLGYEILEEQDEEAPDDTEDNPEDEEAETKKGGAGGGYRPPTGAKTQET